MIERGDQRARILARAPQGGLRIDGGEGGFAERTVSLIDLGWALAAEEDVGLGGGLLDEARVNRLRYLDGTPKAATRWIETGWALAISGGIRRGQVLQFVTGDRRTPINHGWGQVLQFVTDDGRMP